MNVRQVAPPDKSARLNAECILIASEIMLLSQGRLTGTAPQDQRRDAKGQRRKKFLPLI